MERRILSSIAHNFGIDSDLKMLRKAEELMRLVDLRLGCSSLDALCLSGACKAVLCLELAAEANGQPISRSEAVKVSGMNKKMYQSALQAARCLLDLQSQVTIPDLTVTLGCPAVRPLALQILNRYQSDTENKTCGATTVFSQVLFNTVAVYVACRKHHIKCNKTKMVETAGSTSAVFNTLLVQMEKCAETIMSETKEQKSHKKTPCLMDEIVALEEVAENGLNAGNKSSSGDVPDEPFNEWRERILQEAYTALGRERPDHSPSKRPSTKQRHK